MPIGNIKEMNQLRETIKSLDWDIFTQRNNKHGHGAEALFSLSWDDFLEPELWEGFFVENCGEYHYQSSGAEMVILDTYPATMVNSVLWVYLLA